MNDEIDIAQERDLLITTKTVAAATEDARHALAGGGCPDCLDCGGAIPAERRAAYPAAERCIDCERRRERKVP